MDQRHALKNDRNWILDHWHCRVLRDNPSLYHMSFSFSSLDLVSNFDTYNPHFQRQGTEGAHNLI